MMIIPAKFQPSNSTGMGGKCGDKWTRDVTQFLAGTVTKILNSLAGKKFKKFAFCK